MRKLIVFLLIAGAGYFLYTHPERWMKPSAFSNTALNEPFAWKVSSRNDSNGPFNTRVELMNGSRWRIESKKSGSSKIFVAVCDGSRAVSNKPLAFAIALDPRPSVSQVLTMGNKLSAMPNMSPQITEQRDGHTCWKISVNFQGSTVRIWIDSRSRWPVCLDGTINGKYEETHFSPLPLDFAQRSAEFFDTRSTEPLFANYLTP